ncbi:MerR family transcriptional regulator [Sutcliffiella rhizosphaerae]|uniref:Chromosome-anchoring protein RacA n=1 Tax=Sutcliffiella rhizosphaerae TaxID=2880967 RepID=A0ABM8YP85_9BACI|nr:MerR family transcriptional regulator [Sutcliffiella rhizosphaerae]CAG9621790.1 Chromosome-anchoring protein RacA [Sutcliffiella rhizosphaerae]
MLLKTHEVAKELGMAPRTVRKWVKEHDIPCTKNDYGHYVYNAEAIALLETLKGNTETAGTLDLFANGSMEKNREVSSPYNQQDKKIKILTERIMRTEQLLQQKADEVVSYQLLQQRKEIEELTQKVEILEEMLNDVQVKPTTKQETSHFFNQEPPFKNKRKNVFRAIFGL